MGKEFNTRRSLGGLSPSQAHGEENPSGEKVVKGQLSALWNQNPIKKGMQRDEHKITRWKKREDRCSIPKTYEIEGEMEKDD